uniref:Uncharacterized protein n=1 Tax=Lotharella oceanica TaxID=641309 RepID=A0A7S2XA82_9EUKA
MLYHPTLEGLEEGASDSKHNWSEWALVVLMVSANVLLALLLCACYTQTKTNERAEQPTILSKSEWNERATLGLSGGRSQWPYSWTAANGSESVVRTAHDDNGLFTFRGAVPDEHRRPSTSSRRLCTS